MGFNLQKRVPGRLLCYSTCGWAKRVGCKVSTFSAISLDVIFKRRLYRKEFPLRNLISLGLACFPIQLRVHKHFTSHTPVMNSFEVNQKCEDAVLELKSQLCIQTVRVSTCSCTWQLRHEASVGSTSIKLPFVRLNSVNRLDKEKAFRELRATQRRFKLMENESNPRFQLRMIQSA